MILKTIQKNNCELNSDGFVRIAIDAMGGDHGTKVTVPAALSAIAANPRLKLVLVGDQQLLERELSSACADTPKSPGSTDRLTIKHATQVVAMDEHPVHALKYKRDSSLRVALELVNAGEVDAIVSAGNTGALMAISRFVLRMLPGIDRPAIISPLPSATGTTYVLDLGANLDCSSDHLVQFAVMGSILASAVQNKPKPSVGLLNVGSEDIKGTEQIKQAAKLLAIMSGINYFGFVEGNDIYKGTTDVVVCDGFAGNVALKASEGLAKMMLQFTKQEFTKNWCTKLVAFMAKPVFKRILARFDPNNYNGGSLLGLRGVVVKSHGGAGAVAFANAIQVAVKEVEKQVPDKIRQAIEHKMAACGELI